MGCDRNESDAYWMQGEEIARLRAEVAQLTLARDTAVTSFTFNYKRANDAEAEVARLTRELDDAYAAARLLAENNGALRAQLEAVTRERDAFNEAGALDPENAAELAAAHDALRALVTQLAGALRTGVEFVENGAPNEHFMEWAQQARAALAAAEKLLT